MKPPVNELPVAEFSIFPATAPAVSAPHHSAATFLDRFIGRIRSKRVAMTAIALVVLLGVGGYAAVLHFTKPKTVSITQTGGQQTANTPTGAANQPAKTAPSGNSSSSPTAPKPSSTSPSSGTTTSAQTGNTSSAGTSSTGGATGSSTTSGNCFTTPSSCGYPDASTTGPIAGTAFIKVPEQATSGNGWAWDPRGWVSVSGNNVTVNGIQTSANIDITGNGVTLQNCIITEGNGDFGVSLRHTTNTTVKNCRISGTNASSGRLGVAIKSIYGDDVNPRSIANNIYYVSTGIQYCQGIIQDNYIHDLGYQSGDHLNGTTSNSGCNELTIQHNTIFNSFEQTDAISLFEDFGAQYNALITNNYVAGGGYTIYGGANAGGVVPKNVQITNNRISDHYFPNGGYWGWLAAWNGSGSGNVCSGNVLEHTATGKVDPLGC